MIFGNKRNKKHGFYKPKIKIDGQILEIVSETKFLGVLIDDEISWKNHVNYTAKKIAKSIGILSKLKPFLNQKALLQMYYSFIHPYLIYSNVIWGNAPAATLWPIYKLQKVAIRIITNTPRGSSSLHHCITLKILRLPELYIFSTIIFMFKYLNNMMPTALDSLFQKNNAVHSYNTRGASNLRPPRINSAMAEKFITSTGVRLWNLHSPKLDLSTTISTFKKKLTTLLIDEYKNRG
jgi:hypothetical protein